MLAVLATASVALVIGLGGTRFLIGWFRRHGIGQPIHDAVTQHAAKAGTPTMGGLTIAVAVPVSYAIGLIVLDQPPTRAGVVLVAAIMGGAAVGVLDDWMKISRGRNTLGLQERQKTLLILALGVLFVTQSPDGTRGCTAPSFARCEAFPELPLPLWILWVLGVIWLTTNSVNFTDGLDGLLAGSSIAPLALVSVIAFWQFRHEPLYPGSSGTLHVALVMTAATACCLGLLWWSAAPAQIFMGETGSLAIGTALAIAALQLHIELLIPIFGALYVAEGVSSFAQRTWFKLTRRFRSDHEPQRLFRMAPLHHHFELVGWPETTVVIRFWILSAIASAAAGAIFYWDALSVLP